MLDTLFARTDMPTASKKSPKMISRHTPISHRSSTGLLSQASVLSTQIVMLSFLLQTPKLCNLALSSQVVN